MKIKIVPVAMLEINNTDLVLKVLYDQRAHNGMTSIIASIDNYQRTLSLGELIEIKEKLELTRFAIFRKRT